MLLDGEPLDGPFRVEVRRDRGARGAPIYRVFLVGARQLVTIAVADDAADAGALGRRIELALGHEPTQLDVERELRFAEATRAPSWLMPVLVGGYLGLAFALSRWLFAHADLVTQREPIAPLILVSFGAVAYWAWSKVGAASARARLTTELGLRR